MHAINSLIGRQALGLALIGYRQDAGGHPERRDGPWNCCEAELRSSGSGALQLLGSCTYLGILGQSWLNSEDLKLESTVAYVGSSCIFQRDRRLP